MRSFLAAALLVVLALAFVGCGSDGDGEQEARERAVAARKAAAEKRRVAEQRWSDGLRGWSTAMMQPSLRVSGLFTDQASLTLLLDGDPATRRELNAQLAAIRRCSNRVKKIGSAPARFRRARAEAMNACAHLEAGASLVDLGLDAAQGGLGEGLLTRGADELAKGTGLVGTANERLPPS